MLIVHLLIKYNEQIQSPLDVFIKLFGEDWDQYAVSIFAKVPIEDARDSPSLLSRTEYDDLKENTG